MPPMTHTPPINLNSANHFDSLNSGEVIQQPSRVAMSGRGKGFGKGKGEAKGSGTPFLWEDDGGIGPDFFEEAVEEFPVQHRSEFNDESPLRPYDRRRQPWPKCRHGEDCDVQMSTDFCQPGRRFFKCPRAWSTAAPENCGFTRWVDPPPIYPHSEYIHYLQNRICDLEREVDSFMKDYKGDEDSNDGAGGSQEPVCNDPYCNCPHHKNKGPPPSPPPPPPPAMGGYCGEGSTQLNSWYY